MPHPISRPKTKSAKQQQAEDNPQLRGGAECYLFVVPALLVFFRELLWLFGFRLVVVENSAHIPASTAFDQKKNPRDWLSALSRPLRSV